MSLLLSPMAKNSSAGFYNGVALTSVRCDPASNPKLVFTPSSASNRKTWTWSCWVKRSSLGSAQIVFNVGVTGTDEIDFHFTAADQFIISDRGGHNLKTAQLFRDTSAWYNLVVVMDTVQSGVTFSSANALKLYVNGVRVTVFASGTSLPDEDDEFAVNNTRIHHIATRNLGDNDYGGYIAEMNLVDGLALDPSYFGETKNGVWIPIDTSGLTFANGWRLQFDQTGVGTASTSTIGADTSGNTHHFTSSGIVASDCAMIDSPENNFCTWNGLFRGGEQSSSITATSTLSNGNLQVSVPGNSYMGNNFRPVSGKWYCEFRLKTQGSANGETDWGWFQATTYAGVTGHSAQANKWGVYYHAYSTDHIQIFDETTQLGSNINLTISAGDVLQLALDIDNNKGWVGINDTWYRTNASDGNPSNGTNQTFTFTADEAQNLTWYVANGTNTDVYVANFGQDSTFGGDETATSNADANGIGAFHHAPPTDFLAICTSNLPETTIGANSDTQADDHFNTLIYSGNNDATRTFDIGFVSDWSWFKARNKDGYGHQLYDSSRGVQKYLRSNDDSTETTNAEGVTSFDSSGNLAIGTDAFLNEDGTTMVIWNWKANGGTTVTNEAGSIDSTVQANTTAGFSIVTYTGNTDASATIGHGLQVNGVATTPKIIFVKQRDEAGNWIVFTETTGKDNKLNLNATTASAESALFNNADPTSTVFSVKDTSTEDTFGDGHTYVAYCFADVEGYSKFGRYTGTGATSGTAGAYVYLGFRPSFVMLKSTGSGSWWILDSTRDPVNEALRALQANDTPVETGYTGNFLDFYSNGFAPRTSGAQVNGSGTTYIYMAFAEAPFKYANAR